MMGNSRPSRDTMTCMCMGKDNVYLGFVIWADMGDCNPWIFKQAIYESDRGFVRFLLYSAEVRLYRVTGTLTMGARSFDSN